MDLHGSEGRGMSERAPRRRMGRAVVIGVLLIFPNCWFVVHGLFWGQSRPTTVSLIFNVIFTLLLLVMANHGIRRVRPQWAQAAPLLSRPAPG